MKLDIHFFKKNVIAYFTVKITYLTQFVNRFMKCFPTISDTFKLIVIFK